MTLLSVWDPHPATVHFPIGLLVLASVAGLVYLYFRQTPQLNVLTWWPMLIGWVSCAFAVLTGLLAQSNLPPDAPYWQLLNTHVTSGLAIMVVYGSILYPRWVRRNQGQGKDPLLDSSSQKTRLWLTLLLVLGAVLVVATGWSGGQLVYEWGVNVGM